MRKASAPAATASLEVVVAGAGDDRQLAYLLGAGVEERGVPCGELGYSREQVLRVYAFTREAGEKPIDSPSCRAKGSSVSAPRARAISALLPT